MERGGVTSSVPVKANSGVRACVPAAGKVLEKGITNQHYLHYITIVKSVKQNNLQTSRKNCDV